MTTSADPGITGDGVEGRNHYVLLVQGWHRPHHGGANVAWILAANGYRVLAVDWDLESPGLHKYLPSVPPRQGSRGRRPGSSTWSATTPRRSFDRWRRRTRTGSGAAPPTCAPRRLAALGFPAPPSAVRPSAGPTRKGSLDLLPAGRQDTAYTKAVSTFDWQAFFEKLGGNSFLDALAASMRDDYDYVLIDSRTGVSDGAGICTVRLPDAVVTSFTLNDQSIDGAAGVTRSIIRQRGDRPVEICRSRCGWTTQQAQVGGGPGPRAPPLRAPAAPDFRRGERPGTGVRSRSPTSPTTRTRRSWRGSATGPTIEGTLLAAYERLTKAITEDCGRQPASHGGCGCAVSG